MGAVTDTSMTGKSVFNNLINIQLLIPVLDSEPTTTGSFFHVIRHPSAGDRFPPVERFPAAAERYPLNGYGKERAYARDVGPRGGNERYGGGVGPARYDGRSYRERPGPYERPRRGGQLPSLDRY